MKYTGRPPKYDNPEDMQKIIVKYFNQFGLVVLVAAAGLVVLAVRKNHREKIRKIYNPDDPRMGD